MKEEPDFEEELTGFAPNFSGVGMIGMLSWLPSLFSAVLVFALAAVLQVLFNVLTTQRNPLLLSSGCGFLSVDGNRHP